MSNTDTNTALDRHIAKIELDQAYEAEANYAFAIVRLMCETKPTGRVSTLIKEYRNVATDSYGPFEDRPENDSWHIGMDLCALLSDAIYAIHPKSRTRLFALIDNWLNLPPF